MPEKNSIAFVANTSWSIYKFRLYLIKKLLAYGYRIFVLAPRDAYTAHFESLGGLTYIELLKFRGKSMSPFAALALYRELLRHYRRIQPDLIFHYTIKANIFGSWAAARTRRPSISVITGLGYVFAGDGLLKAAAKLLYRRSLRKNAEVWFLNADDREVFLRENLVRSERSFILPGEGVDTELFSPSPFKAGEGPIRFLLIGRVIRHKGIYEYVQAADILRSEGMNVQCSLLGFFDAGNPVAISERQVDQWVQRGSIRYLGSTDDVAPYIAGADCVVLPSYREGMPLSLLEGASMGKALIATDTAGCREVVREGSNGYLCRLKDGEDLAEKMKKYVSLPPEEKTRMGMAGRERVKAKYEREIVVGIVLDKIKSLLGH
ncbi:MAG: glycosyltransferase family 4 protein [Bacteroidota bacterium]|nr:glycosyltransferase family 4 protein [Bacteroidota bacterium]MDP4215243.1 glycosyltransferase family 4 protein [Bacteroidota bacterium]MDP4247763.1 glycosyltransferase family 4 protein [Bacteroidota bacterium]MDP4254719.1 glycosyltransferase family 4 protein [Bacteroidota bacterium]MDP4258091.1 glycosyltransferase family 4 protein [Bacteroidota bacterium]